MSPVVVAIDGAAGAGKSTLARGLARELGLAYVDTGLMYRALAAAALREGSDLEDEDALVQVARSLRFRMRDSRPSELEVEGWNEAALTQPEVEVHVSRAARHPKVREVMRRIQRSLGEGEDCVMEGRDIGTVVFPDARVKIFLTADPNERGARRLVERDSPGDDVARDLHARDAQDSKVIPLVPADDAVVIDTTALTPKQTRERALEIVRQRR